MCVSSPHGRTSTKSCHERIAATIPNYASFLVPPASHTETHKKHSYSPCSSGNAKSPKAGLKDGLWCFLFLFVNLKVTFGFYLLLSGVAMWAFSVMIPSHLDPAMALPTWHLHVSPHIYKVFSQQLETRLEIIKQITHSRPCHPSNGFFPHRS